MAMNGNFTQSADQTPAATRPIGGLVRRWVHGAGLLAFLLSSGFIRARPKG
jgi:hypothetical protein